MESDLSYHRRGVNIRRGADQDWPLIYPFYAAIMAEGKTHGRANSGVS